MSLTAAWVRIAGGILVLVGLLVMLSAFGMDMGLKAPVPFLAQLAIGALVLVLGAWLAMGRPVSA